MIAAGTEDELLDALIADYEGCQRCILHHERNAVVFGEGSTVPGSILVVGEAPGEHEDHTGIPFVGNSGQLQDEFFMFHGHTKRLWDMQDDYNDQVDLDYEKLRQYLVEDERLFYTNSVLCRPPGNRNPNRQELSSCVDRLFETIYLIDPIIIVTLGKIPLSYLTRKAFSIQDVHGRLMMCKIPGRATEITYPLFPMYHPSFIAREGDPNAARSFSRQHEEDLQKLFTHVDLARMTLLGEERPQRYPE